LSECAPDAGSRSSSTDTPAPDVAPVYVLGRYAAGRSPVYNLTVQDQPEFFANGVLVHNCLDALRYLLMGRDVVADLAAPVEITQDNVWSAGESAVDYGGYGDYAAGGGFADYSR
jgi:hypothetical protein